MQVKQKNDTTWLTWLFAATVLLGLTIQLILGVARDIRLRFEAEQAANAFLLRTEELAADENARLDALRKQIGSSSQTAFVLKEEKRLQRELLILVNPWNEVPEGYMPELSPINDEQAVDSRCIAPLLQMLEDCKAAGCVPYVCSSYRTYDMQEFLFNNKIRRVMEEGYGYWEAPEIAAKSVAVPGTSEHQLGLAVDIIDEYYPNLTYWQENTATQQWLMKNCTDYGFILRYPNGTTDITGIIYEPWHYRYVGFEAAKEIEELGVTFEEYIALRRGR